MNQAQAAVFAAVILGFVTLLGVVMSGLATQRRERWRRDVEKEFARQKEIRSQAAEVFGRMFAMARDRLNYLARSERSAVPRWRDGS
jgi:hypothetical protein